MTFYCARGRLFGGEPKKGTKGRKFQARDVAHAREKIQRLSDRTGKRFDLWYSKDYPRPNPRRNPLPVGRLVKVRARRLKNGRVELYRA